MNIKPATRDHADLIAEAIVMAITPELSLATLGSKGASLDRIKELFASLAAMEESQYSYRNTIVAEDDNGNPTGAIVAYDGAMLHTLREPFLTAASDMLGLDLRGEITDETTPDEYYIDTLAVMPSSRGKGVATALLRAAIARGTEAGKRPGLLVDKANASARRLYERLGFRHSGDRMFIGEMMDHLTLDSQR